jgi:hypothetical protein
VLLGHYRLVGRDYCVYFVLEEHDSTGASLGNREDFEVCDSQAPGLYNYGDTIALKANHSYDLDVISECSRLIETGVADTASASGSAAWDLNIDFMQQ